MRHHRPGHCLARLLRRRVGDDRDRSGLNGLIDEAVAVGRFPAHRNENAPRLDLPRIVFHTTDVRVPAVAENLGAIQQMLEGHCSGL